MHRRDFLAVGAAAAAGVTQGLDAVRAALAAALQTVDARADAASFASQYSVAPGLQYFNHASIGTQPVAVRTARAARLALCETNPWLYVWGGAWEEDLGLARNSAARVLGANADDVAFLRSTTEAFNVLASGLALGPGDEVLFSSLNHIGASACWRRWSA
ncbi:MAG: aminotransferase class V-fold PLP-dependent enzyme, partial [Planctomycetota bacterium]